MGIRVFASRVGLSALAVSLLLLPGCSGDDEGGTASRALPVCDITQAACQKSIFASVARLRGSSAGALPAIRTMTRAELEPEIRSEYTKAQSEADAVWDRAFALLHWMPDTSPAVDVYVSHFFDNVAAYYDEDDKRVTIIKRDETVDWQAESFTLAHEFAHALQDRAVDLHAYRKQHVKDSDSSLAVRSLIEGEATLLSNVLLVRKLGYEAEKANWPEYVSRLYQSAASAVTKGDAPLADSFQLLPYPLGTGFLYANYLTQGQRWIDSVYADPPLSALSWAEPPGSASAPETLDCQPTLAPPGYQVFDLDSLGIASQFALTLGGGSLPGALRSDRIVVFTEPGVPTAQSRLLVAWRSRLASRLDQPVLAALARDALAARIDLVGDRDVLIRAATDPSLLAETSTSQCGPADPPRARTAQSANASGPSVRRLRFWHDHFLASSMR